MKNMIKKMALLSIAILVFTLMSQAQKYAFIDSEYILKNVPEYQDAQNQL
ncbi:MAG: hypothetical protein CSB02_00600, partial [Bacteroidia bacterium]